MEAAMTAERCGEFTASLSFGGQRLGCKNSARFTVKKASEKNGQEHFDEKPVCLVHLRKLRNEGWEKVKQDA